MTHHTDTEDTVTHDRRLEIIVSDAGYLIETAWHNGIGWTVLSRTVTQTWPWHVVSRVLDRGDYRIHVRAV